MKILILSCNTGEGHNSAGRAVKEYLELQGHQVVMEDMMLLKGARTSKAVSGAYVGIVKHCPLLFGLGYRLGGWVSSDKRKSPDIIPAVFWRERYNGIWSRTGLMPL